MASHFRRNESFCGQFSTTQNFHCIHSVQHKCLLLHGYRPFAISSSSSWLDTTFGSRLAAACCFGCNKLIMWSAGQSNSKQDTCSQLDLSVSILLHHVHNSEVYHTEQTWSMISQDQFRHHKHWNLFPTSNTVCSTSYIPEWMAE